MGFLLGKGRVSVSQTLYRITHQAYNLSSWRVAIVGSGPSGCYTAKYLNSSELNSTEGKESNTKNSSSDSKHASKRISMDIFERLPTAYGLVRNGVAPDHPEVKNVQHDFDTLIQENDNIRFYGNVRLGQDVSLEELRSWYDVVVLAYGCESDRPLSIPGATLSGILSAREFVAWYNGHVDFDWVGPIVEKALEPKGSHKDNTSNGSSSSSNIVVVGHGNVALDCARILAKSRDELDPTDIASRAINSLDPPSSHNTSPVPRTVSVVGRRGHVQGAFTIKELRELTKLPNAAFVVRPDELEMGMSTQASQEELNDSRPRKRMDKLLTEAASKEGDDAIHKKKDQVHLRFLMNPVRFEASAEDPSTLGHVVCERTRLVGETGKQQAEGTGEEESLDAQLALVSIGYKGVAVDGTEPWFDESRGTLKNTHGLVDAASESAGGLYTAGWLKRGPSGIIGTNIADAKDTVAKIIHDAEPSTPRARTRTSGRSIVDLLKKRDVRFVDWEAYQAIDAAERSDQRKRNVKQPREKITDTKTLLEVAFEKDT